MMIATHRHDALQRQITRLLLTGILLAGLPQLINAQLLQNGFTTTYDVHHNSIYLGETVRTLSKQQNGQWEYASATEAKGLVRAFVKDRIEERSLLTISPNIIKPYSYHYDQSGGKRKLSFHLDFDWQKNTLSNSYLKQEFELVPGTQNLLSFVLQIMLALQHKSQFIEMHIADKRRLDAYQLKIVGQETIDTPYKSLPTIVLLSNKIKGKRQFKIWCAPSLQFLPVRIQKIEDDGDEDVMSLKELKIYKAPLN